MNYRYTPNNNDLLLTATQRRHKSLKNRLLVASLLLAGVSIFWISCKHLASNSVVPTPAVAQNQLALASPATILPAATPDNKPPVSAQVQNTPAPQWQTIILKKGDTLGKIFNKAGLNIVQAQAVMAVKDAKQSLRLLKPGNEIKLLVSPDKKLQQLSFAINALDTLHVSRNNNALTAEISHLKPETELTYAAATVTKSLSQATSKAGLQTKLVHQLATIFKDKVNLARVRNGDKLKLLFEEDYINGKRVRTGNIAAAEVTVQGNVYRAVRYVDAKGVAEYYTPEGLSLKKGFNRYPVNYKYISSGFSHHRFDPILQRMASHEAIDFKAVEGAPIKASGDGKVIYAAAGHGYGNMVKIQHDRKFTSLYAHMSRFGQNIRPGTAVKAGQVIGYVGHTGMATGSHLHYEFLVNGVKQNPLTVALPSAAPLNRLARATFIPQARQLMARLKVDSRVRLVANNHANTNG